MAPPPISSTLTRLQEDEAALLVRRATNPRSRTEHRAAAQSLATSIPLPNDLPPPTAALSVVEPSSYKKALKSPEKAHWLLATDKEFSSLSSKGTWHLVPLSSPMRVIGCSWKYKVKRDSTGSILKYKARLVVRGDMQDLDYTSVFAPTVRYTTLHVPSSTLAYLRMPHHWSHFYL